MSKYVQLKKKLDNAKVELKYHSKRIKENKKKITEECDQLGLPNESVKNTLKTIKQAKNKLQDERKHLKKNIELLLEKIEKDSF